MVKLQEGLLICLISLVTICPARRQCRAQGGRCVRSLSDYPCSDPNGAVLTPRGWPLCRNNRYCCVASPGVLCFPDPSIHGPESFCMLPSSDPLTCTGPDGTTPYGLQMKFGDSKCQDVLNNTRCCTVLNQCSVNPTGYCGPKYTLQNLEESCRNGIHYPAGDGACTNANAPWCCLATQQQCGPEATCKPMCGLGSPYPLGDALCDDSTKCCTDEPMTTPPVLTTTESSDDITTSATTTISSFSSFSSSSSDDTGAPTTPYKSSITTKKYSATITFIPSSSFMSSSDEVTDADPTTELYTGSSYDESVSISTEKTISEKTTQAGASSAVVPGTGKPTQSSSANDPTTKRPTTKRTFIPIRPL